MKLLFCIFELTNTKHTTEWNSNQNTSILLPITDLKKIFGEEPNKDLLLDFLNELLKEEEEQITSVSYKKAAQLVHQFISSQLYFMLLFPFYFV